MSSMPNTEYKIPNTKKPQVVFLGAGPVALESLKSLHKNFEIEHVISKPNPKSSRAPRLVAQWAEEQSLPLLQPNDKHELETMVAKANFTSRVGIVVDYGMIIKDSTLNNFELGIINSHFSLLPEWRGADPITFSLLSGQPQTGVSLMKIVAKMDEGDLLAQSIYDIEPDETIHSLTDNLVDLSNQMLGEILPLYLEDKIELYPQDESTEATYSRKLTKQDGHIDWNKPAVEIEREIRSYLGWPGSFTDLGKTKAIITKAHSIPSNQQGSKPGNFEAVKETGCIIVETSSGQICISRLKPSGKQEMDASSFINGYLNK